MDQELLEQYRSQLKCSFEQLDDTFEDCMLEAFISLSDQGIKDYLKGASLVCMIGRGFEPVLVYLEEMPQVAKLLGEKSLTTVSQIVWELSRSPNGNSIPPFLNSVAEAARRLGSEELFQKYIDLLCALAEKTTGSIHGHHTTFPSPGLPLLLANIPYLLNQLSLEGLQNWVDYGVRNYPDHPERQENYFSLQSADSKAILQRERHGTLFIDNERKLSLYLKALWNKKLYMIPYSTGFDELRKPIPYYDNLGARLPDVLDDIQGANGETVLGIDRYRAILAHIVGHKRWSSAIFADNLSPFQRIAVELFEDSRVEYLAAKIYPGLRKIFLSLHPKPIEDDCKMEQESCIRHRLTMLSYAILNPEHDYKNADIIEFSQRFHDAMLASDASTQAMSVLATSFIARTRRQTDQLANMYFKDTEVAYRDDNRHLWKFIEMGDEEEMFAQKESQAKEDEEEDKGLPPRHYHEWDYATKSYRPDWVSLYETLHPPGNPADIDALLDKHAILAKRLKQLLDLLKPQQYVRVRYQEDGSELDLDTAIRSLIDYKSGSTPDPRINMSHKHDGRDIAVMLLLDLSASLNETPPGSDKTILELSQEAVALLSYAIEHLGDQFAIAGFSSNTRHEVRYQHIKGYSEHWGDEVKARLAAIEAGYSTRMGAALRHAAHYLGNCQAEKKLLLVLTDGEPADIDVSDSKLLIEDTRKAVQELDQDGIYTFCINLDPHADDYVQTIFGKQFLVIDKVEQLPEKLPYLFMSLTG
ncbi:nitric oxide reductase activation protein NorD [sulfur-oxidizing endosymbiont of Gigantopelta aegis]|uniref:nitric oxide reductase activation protein NorD n=1 Tax=sulfur-oxidizing endosymbiont of Gigantopelta aegis TaxID=2794934 RepID=UPI0018DC7ED9|nr:VWA domain-containing protein [sulfur-oxidizing endosymbiont of Gigantopelta aegis]